MMVSRFSPEPCTVLAYSCCSGVSSVSSRSSDMPMIPFMGVRISCDMLARNSILARLASSASSRALIISASARFWCVMSATVPSIPTTSLLSCLSRCPLMDSQTPADYLEVLPGNVVDRRGHVFGRIVAEHTGKGGIGCYHVPFQVGLVDTFGRIVEDAAVLLLGLLQDLLRLPVLVLQTVEPPGHQGNPDSHPVEASPLSLQPQQTEDDRHDHYGGQQPPNQEAARGTPADQSRHSLFCPWQYTDRRGLILVSVNTAGKYARSAAPGACSPTPHPATGEPGDDDIFCGEG